MTPDPIELKQRTDEALKRLIDRGPSHALATCRDLIDLGFDARTAWRLVEVALTGHGKPA